VTASEIAYFNAHFLRTWLEGRKRSRRRHAEISANVWMICAAAEGLAKDTVFEELMDRLRLSPKRAGRG
jgi:hypothetical protein